MRPIVLSLMLVLAASACATAPPEPPRVTARIRPSLAERTGLSAELRQQLHERMDHHGVAMNDLVWSVLLLDREQTALIAAEIVLWQQVASPLAPAAPRRFAELERALQLETDTLGRLARAPGSTDAEIGRSFARLSSVCVDCHAAYLYGEATAD